MSCRWHTNALCWSYWTHLIKVVSCFQDCNSQIYKLAQLQVMVWHRKGDKTIHNLNLLFTDALWRLSALVQYVDIILLHAYSLLINQQTFSCNPILLTTKNLSTVEPLWKGQECLTKVAKFCSFPCTTLCKSCLFYPSWQATSFERPPFWVAL